MSGKFWYGFIFSIPSLALWLIVWYGKVPSDSEVYVIYAMALMFLLTLPDSLYLLLVFFASWFLGLEIKEKFNITLINTFLGSLMFACIPLSVVMAHRVGMRRFGK